MRILLVEDDAMLGAATQQRLRDEAYAVDWVVDADAAELALRDAAYEAVLLDLGLPGRDGLELLRTLRQRGNAVAVLVLTARDAVQDCIAALDLGADDYLNKPFDSGELLARLRAVVRRRAGQATAVLGNGRVRLDPRSRRAASGAAEVQLTAREFALLHALLLRPGAILSRRELEDRIYGWNEEVESNAVEFLIHGLRRKLGADVIRNVRGVGWMVERERRDDDA
jgi:two-component system OmpR family response regulator